MWKLQWTCQIVIYSRFSLDIERLFSLLQSKSWLDYLVLYYANLVLCCISLAYSFFGKNTCGRVSFLLAYYRCFLAFCPCELLGWFLYNGNIGKYKANILVSYISPRVSHNVMVWGEHCTQPITFFWTPPPPFPWSTP